MAETADHADHAYHPHVTPPRTHLLVFGGLILLTVLTVGLSFLHGVPEIWHTVIGLTIATAKAALVFLFFMHLLYSSRLTWLVALGSLLWLAILIILTLSDYLTRTWLPVPGK